MGVGLSALGALLRRQRWVDQVEWKVFPNQSLILIGPSGIGKDTAINRAQAYIEKFGAVPVIGGTTFENIQERLARLAKPACAYLPAAEMTKFFGKADYQANMLTGMTDLLSTGEKIDITTKGQLYNQDGSKKPPRFIEQPTLTLHGGSTVEWLHKHMPDGTLEGGFLGRFLIICEEFGGRHVPLIKATRNPEEIRAVKAELEEWDKGTKELLAKCERSREVILLTDAEDMYTNWYYNRFKLFSKAVLPYANRSRDTVLRLAMLMAISRNHHRYIEPEDVEFAIKVMRLVAERIDKVVLPPTDEAKAASEILQLLPASDMEIWSVLGVKYTNRTIQDATILNVRSGRMRADEKLRCYVTVEVNEETKNPNLGH